MKNIWIRFGCFLTGYNYVIVKNCSEISVKAVKRYTSALLIVCLLWAFIGFSFTNRYLTGGLFASIIGSLVFIIIIIQIERQIILAVSPSNWLYLTRGIIAVTMAIIGSVILDQIIFQQDIELEKITFIEARVNKALDSKTRELRTQIDDLQQAITKKDTERQNYINEIAKNPTSIIYSTSSTNQTEKNITIDPITGNNITTEKTVPVKVINSSNVPNPKISMIVPIQQSINNLNIQKSKKESALLNIRPQLEKDISSKVGFLDELEVMWSLITKSNVALTIWIIWFVLLFGIEMLVLVSKLFEDENDYDRIIRHHMTLQMKKLDLFEQMAKG
jgi:cell division protein FtsB